MATCYDCIHSDVCSGISACSYHCSDVSKCKHFKNKANFVEVVHCRDCKYFYCFSAIDRQFYCRHYPKGLYGINVVEENPFCSYGERKSKNDFKE